jgi:hypothetical protein
MRLRILPAVVAAAAIAGLGTTAAASAATATSAAPATKYVQNGDYAFASNTGNVGLTGSGDTFWQVLGSPISYPQSSQTLGADGVDLSITPDSTAPYSGYADSGVIMPIGTIAGSGLLNTDGSLSVPLVTGSSNLAVNIYFDTNGDGTFFSFNSAGVYEGEDGDSVVDVAPGATSIPAATVTADENATQGTSTLIWAWVGIDSSTPGTVTGKVATFDYEPLTAPAPPPAKVANLTAKAVCVSGKTRSWLVTDKGTAGTTFHYYVKRNGHFVYQGKPTAITAGHSVGVKTFNGTNLKVTYNSKTIYATANSKKC